MPVSLLTDLEDGLLTQIIELVGHPASLCRLASAAVAFRRLVLRDAASAAQIWSRPLRCIGWPAVGAGSDNAGEHPPSAALYRALSAISAASWSKPAAVDPPSSLASRWHGGITGAASCNLDGSRLLFGGTQNGNTGPVIDDLLVLEHDAVGGVLRVQGAGVVAAGAMDVDPGARRGHTLTATTFADDTEVAVLLGGWGNREHSMEPYFLTSLLSPAPSGGADGDVNCRRVYRWSRRPIAGQPPAPRAFHSTTEVAPGVLLVYGGLGAAVGCTDVALLDLRSMLWSQPLVAGIPRSTGGRAGHGAVFFTYGPSLGLEGSASETGDNSHGR
jgi:hypothetical protein